MTTGLIILAGGQSRRMGTNKALLPIGGKTNIQKIVDTLHPCFNHTLVVTNDQETYRWLNLPMVSDLYPGLGPLAGIHAGLLAAAADRNLVVACDMPFISAALANYLIQLNVDTDSIVPSWEGQLHPLFAVYRKTCIPTIEKCLTSHRLRMTDFLNELKVRYVQTPELKTMIPDENPFTNMNTPEEYHKVLSMLKAKTEE